jgi:nucleotidyltransferase substrate binding protein (TIGR01987 family)
MNEPALDLGSLRKALASLEGAIEIVSNTAWFDRQPANLQNTLIAGVVQNFEFVYELSIKMLKRRIEIHSSSPGDIDGASFRDLLRIAGEKGLIADVEAWFKYRRMRDLTSHSYDREKALEIYRDTLTFAGDAESLLAALEARNG